ncbi:MAG: hypothetical protein GXY33_13685 [Phycisphaerae bacterium]|nr:hypothetical protein [Phycisphaerae bacterium]
MADEELKSCEVCGATVYPEHIKAGRAAFWAGQLLCAVCLNEKKSESSSTAAPAVAGQEEPLSLVDEDDMDKSSSRIIKAMGAGGVASQGGFDDSKLARAVNKSGTGATRVRIFHTKMNDGAVNFMSQTINEWVDQNPEVEIKIVESTVGVWEGKHPEPHLILTIWY